MLRRHRAKNETLRVKNVQPQLDVAINAVADLYDRGFHMDRMVFDGINVHFADLNPRFRRCGLPR